MIVFVLFYSSFLFLQSSHVSSANAGKLSKTFLEVQYACEMQEKEREQRLSIYLQFYPLDEAQRLIKSAAARRLHSLYINPEEQWAVFEEINLSEAGDTLSQDLFYQGRDMKDIYVVRASDLGKKSISSIQVYPPQASMSWELLEGETKKVLGFTCQKALLKVGNQSYAVWFTPDIPLSYGPRKYMGRGGLILEMDGSTYHFEAVSIREVSKIPFLPPQQAVLNPNKLPAAAKSNRN